ncbi:MAG: hypothetical protein RIT28_2763 [Pseudomonadota bacterium]
MSLLRAASFTTALTLTACGSTVAEPPPTAAGDVAFVEPSPAAAGDATFVEPPPTAAGDVAFAAPRAADRAADPMVQAPGTCGDLGLGEPFTPIGDGVGMMLQQDQPAVLAELQHNAGHLQRCWQSRSSEARAGKIVIHAHIGADGLVRGQCVTEDTVGDRELLQCANDLVAMGRYPKLGDETVDVVIPLHFWGGEG